MLKRVVKMTFKEEDVQRFQSLFFEKRGRILAQPGCQSVSLLQDNKDSRIHFTISLWDSEADLNRYRSSDFFAETWKQTKVMFDERPEAWSTFAVLDPAVHQ